MSIAVIMSLQRSLQIPLVFASRYPQSNGTDSCRNENMFRALAVSFVARDEGMEVVMHEGKCIIMVYCVTVSCGFLSEDILKVFQ